MLGWPVARAIGSKPTKNVQKRLCEQCVPPIRQPLGVVCANFIGRTQWYVGSAPDEVCTCISQPLANRRYTHHAPTAVGGTADGIRRSTVDTLNMGESAGTQVKPWPETFPMLSSPTPSPHLLTLERVLEKNSNTTLQQLLSPV